VRISTASGSGRRRSLPLAALIQGVFSVLAVANRSREAK
jgi:hypothetical protein